MAVLPSPRHLPLHRMRCLVHGGSSQTPRLRGASRVDGGVALLPCGPAPPPFLSLLRCHSKRSSAWGDIPTSRAHGQKSSGIHPPGNLPGPHLLLPAKCPSQVACLSLASPRALPQAPFMLHSSDLFTLPSPSQD